MFIATIFILPKVNTIQISIKNKMDKLIVLKSYHRVSCSGKTISKIHTTRTNFPNTMLTENTKSQKNAYIV